MTETAKPVDARTRTVEALLALCAEQGYNSVTLPMIAARAEVSLADLRDLFPSKGAILGGLMRIVDRKVLTTLDAGMEDQPVRERVLDVMLKRFEALAPYKAGLADIRKSLACDLSALVALNQAALNSWRYMLAAAGVDAENHLSFLKLQGAAMVFGRAFDTWLTDDAPDLSRTMAVLDRELKRGEWVLERAEGLHRAGKAFEDMMAGFRRRAEEARARRGDTSRAYSRDDWKKDAEGDDFAPAI